MPADPFEQRIFAILSAVTAIPSEQIRPEHTLAGDLGMDSVASMELFGMMDETFQVEIDLTALSDVKDVQSVIDLARKATAAHV
jgi:acyl carrier protein